MAEVKEAVSPLESFFKYRLKLVIKVLTVRCQLVAQFGWAVAGLGLLDAMAIITPWDSVIGVEELLLVFKNLSIRFQSPIKGRHQHCLAEQAALSKMEKCS